jgi:hypothetical protein
LISAAHPTTLPAVEPNRAGTGVLTLIGVFKLVKVAILLTLGILALVEGHDRFTHALAHATRWTGVFSGRELFQRALARVLALDERTIHRIGVASLAYAAVFATEGTGLLLRRRWAEWLTIGVTASFVPLEAYELWRKPHAGRAVALALNLAIVAYLVVRRVRERRGEAP